MANRAASPQLRKTPQGQLIYRPGGPVVARFLMTNNHVDVIRGPIGSGKSVACCQRIWRHACEQFPSPVDGVKRSRWAIVRNTYPELKSTTVKTWLDIFPENLYGQFYWGMPLTHRMKVSNVDLEAIFVALDKPEDVSKLRSLELTGIWYNELQYIPRELFDEGESRTGRFPAMKDGGSRWHGVIADMNEPDEDHFIPMMTGEVDLPEGMPQDEREKYVWPAEWGYFIQPPGLVERIGPDGRTVVGYEENPAAENRDWLMPGFYLEKAKGKTKAWIESRLMNRINLYVEGDPVHSAFSIETHVAREALRPVPGRTIYVGLDFGRSPAALFAQLVDNCWIVLDELIGFNEGASMFAPKVKRFLEQRFPGYEYEAWGDPKGQDKGQADERTAYDIFTANGVRVRPAPVKQNAIQTRLDAVDNALTTMWNGKPRMLVSPTCRTFRAGMAGKYCWAKDDEGKKAPAKNRWSHICFVADTPVATPGGEIEIQFLSVGDMVETPMGPRRIRMTTRRPAPALVCVELSNGTEIVCTPDHPFAVDGGFLRADALQYGDLLFARGEPWGGQRNILSRSSTGSDSTDAPAATILDIRARVAATCTGSSGSITTALSRLASRFTTLIATARTIASRTLSSWLSRTTPDSISGSGSTRDRSTRRAIEWHNFDLSRPNGTGPTRAVLGIGSTPPEWPPRLFPTVSSAPGAEANTMASPAVESAGSAECLVRGRPGELPASTTKSGPASSAAAPSPSTDTPSRKRAVAVVGVSEVPANGTLVYDIEVEEAHVFYAGGVLVHNCDAGQYMVLGGGEGKEMLGLRRHGGEPRRVVPAFKRGAKRRIG